MKTKQLLVALFLLFSTNLFAQTNFASVASGTSTYYPQEIFFGDSEEVYNVGQCSIRGTTNGEINWSGYCYTILHLLGGDAPARANCFVVGAKGVIRKNQSCSIFGSWQDQNSGTIDSLFSVKFFNIDTGFVVGQNGKVLRTFNNGRNWTIIPSGVTQTLRRLVFTPNHSLYAVGDNGVALKSTDNATTWTVLSTGTTDAITDIDFVGNDTGYVVGANGLFLQTIDAGVTWNTLNSGVATKLTAVDFTSGTTGFITGNNGVIRKTTDAGATWTAYVISTFNNTVFDIKFRDANNGYFITLFDMYRTIDGGVSWYNMSQELQCVEFPTKDIGYALGYNVMRKTTDGGLTWSATHPFNYSTMYDAFFINADTGYASGYFGNIFKTTNGGNTWIKQVTNCTALLRSIHFFNATNGIAVGTNYTITRTTNGGATWVTDSAINSNQYGYHDIFFATPNIGYMCGSQGKIYKTINGGASFTAQTSGTTYYLLKIYFLDTLKGFAIGEHGTILKTLNGGTTWSTVSSGTTSYLSAIAFADSLHGYIGGEGGAFRETTNGGTTWTNKTFNSGNIFDITFYDGYNGYLVGAGDHRAKYDPLKAFNLFSDFCNNGGYYIKTALPQNVIIDTGNVFVMEMDTAGNNFTNPITMGTIKSDTSGVDLHMALPPNTPAGRYKVRMRATKSHPVNTSLETTIRVFEDPEAKIIISNDTLFTAYNPNYLYQWRNGYIKIPGANSNFVVITQQGDYNVTITYGCCNDGYDVVYLSQCNGQWVAAPKAKSNFYACDSESVKIYATGVSQYHWYDSDTSTTVLSSDSFYVTPPVTATDTFYVAAVYGTCESARIKILVLKTTKPAPPVVTNFYQCSKNEIFIFPQGGYAYDWYSDSTSQPFLTYSNWYHISNPVTDTLFVTIDNNGCPSVFVPIYITAGITPLAKNISGDSAVVPLQTSTYTYATTAGNTLQWLVNGGTFTVYPDSIVVVWNVTGTGTVQVVETDPNGCIGDTVALAVDVNIINAISGIANANISIFPNPATNNLHINLKNIAGNNLKALIYDPLGRLAKSVDLANGENNINIKSLPAGIYFVKILSEEQMLSGKTILKKE